MRRDGVLTELCHKRHLESAYNHYFYQVAAYLYGELPKQISYIL